MKQLIAVLTILVMGSVESTSPGLRVTFNVGLLPGRNFFFDMPRHVDDAYAKEWTQVKRPPSPLPTLIMYCPKERVICTLYDRDTLYIAGLQIALPLNEFIGAPFNWTAQGFIPWTPPVDGGAESVTYMTKQLYFVSQETLLKSKEHRMQTALADEVLQEKSVWAMGINQQLFEVPTDVEGILNVGFTKQACIPWMGNHYYYNMTHETKCSAQDLLNWFPLVHNDKLIGVGFVSFGSLEEKHGERFYFERPPKLAVQTIVPRGPECLYQLAEDPTLTTMHVYFIDQPWLIYCPLFP